MTKSAAPRKVSVVSLVGKDIAGMKAITTHPDCRYQYPDGVPVRSLIKAEWKTEKKRQWLYLYWEKTNDIRDCGYSGWREDYGDAPMVELLECAA